VKVSVARQLVARSCVVLLLLPPALTAGQGKGHGKGREKGKEEQEDGAVSIRFVPAERDRAQAYFLEKHGRGNCPPGLAKKQNGCLPPGQAKKRYLMGQPLPAEVRVQPVPVELSLRIGMPPHGYEYGIVDGDLVKLVVGTKMVVDAIDGLVH